MVFSQKKRQKPTRYMFILIGFFIISLGTLFRDQMMFHGNDWSSLEMNFDHGDSLPEDVYTSFPLGYHDETHQLLLEQPGTSLWFTLPTSTIYLNVEISIGLLDHVQPADNRMTPLEGTFLCKYGGIKKSITVTKCDAYILEFNFVSTSPLEIIYNHPVKSSESYEFALIGIQFIHIHYVSLGR